MSKETKTIEIKSADVSFSRTCFICEKNENDNSIFTIREAWICPECKERLKRVLYPEAGE